MKFHRGEIISLLIIILASLLSAYVYPMLPSEIASHWNALGEVDGYMPKIWGLFLMPALALLLWIVFLIIPHIDPKKENIEKFRPSFDNFIVVLFAFLLYVHGLTIAWNLGYQFDLVRWLLPAFAVLFYDIGSLIGKAKMNWMIGIRTPWTLSSEQVWKETHAWGGKLFKATGIIALAGIIYPSLALWFFLVPLLGSTIWLIVFSYVRFHQLRG